MTTAFVQAEHLRKVFGTGATRTVAVNDLSLSLAKGSCAGIVGESGSGKSTTARMLVGLEAPTSGSLSIGGMDPWRRGRRDRRFYSLVQMVFQDPYQSLSPRMTVGTAIGYSPRGADSRADRQRRVYEVLDLVGLPRAVVSRYPHELSTGQRQRVGIARAFINKPALIVADEPVSSLDVSLQSQIINLLADLQVETGVTYLVISHDLAIISALCDYVLVMKDGDVIEEGPTSLIMESPGDPYTQKLVAAAVVDV